MDDAAQSIESIFAEALLQPGPAQRSAFLAGVCGNDARLRARVEALLKAHDDAGSFLTVTESPLQVPTLDVGPPAIQTSTAWATPISEVAGYRIGPYKLLQLIGEGGFGSVFMAEQQHPVTRRVALKIIKLGMDTRSVIARFEAERQALAMMDHANIARVLDAGTTDSGRPYFVMELVKGDPITEYADRNKLSIAERLDLFTQVCNAVQHAHQKGIIHRDLKPSNILVSTQDGKPFARVIDFGIAKATASRLTEKTVFTEFHQLIGTPQYMSPEQADGSLDIDTRTDVYSLGVLLYELLTGSTPFDAKALRSAAYEEMRRMIREVDPPKPSTRLSQSVAALPGVALNRRTEPLKLGGLVRGELDWIVMKALDKDRSRRYDSPSTLAADVLRHIAGEPVVAAPPGTAYRLRKLARRYRTLLATTATIITLLAGGVVVSSLQTMRARRAERTVANQLGEVRDQKTAALAANAAAEAASTKFRQQLSESYVERGITAWELRQPSRAALWFVQALKLDKGNAEREEIQRLRIGMSLFFSPRPLDIPVKYPARATSPSGRPSNASMNDQDRPALRVAVVGSYVEVFNTSSSQPILPRLEHGTQVFACVLSPDGRLIGTFARDNALRLWDASTGKLVMPPLPHPDGLNIRLFSQDGSLLLAENDALDRVCVWDTRTGLILMDVHGARFKAGISPDGTVVAFLDDLGLHLRLVRTGQDAAPPLNIPDFSPDSVAFSHDGKTVLVICNHGGFCLWRPGGPKPDWQKGGRVVDTIFSADESLMAVACDDGTVRVWNVATAQAITAEMLHPAEPSVLCFNSDNRFLLTKSNQIFRVWEVATGRAITPPFAQVEEYGRADFSADGNSVIVEDYPGQPTTWDILSHEYSYMGGMDFDHPIFACTPDGRTLLARGRTGGLRLLDPATAKPVVPPIPSNDELVAPLSPDGKTVAAITGKRDAKKGGAGVTVQLFDVSTGLPASPPMLNEDVWDLSFRADGKTLLAVGENAARVWNLESGAVSELRFALPDESSSPMTVKGALSPDGRYAAVSRKPAGPIEVWDLRTGKPAMAPFRIKGMYADSLRFVGDGHTLLAAGSYGKAWSWVIPDGKQVSVPKAGRDDTSYSPDAKRVVTDRVWDAVSGRPLTPILDPATILHSSFSPDGKWVATGNDRKVAWVYDSRTGRPVTPPLEFQGGIIRTLFTRHSVLFAVTEDTGQVNLYPLAVNSMELADLEPLSELLSGSRMDETGGLVEWEPSERMERWESLRKRIPSYFKPVVELSENEVLPRYRSAVEARFAAAKSDQDRQALARSLDEQCNAELQDAQFGEAILLAETALKIDPNLPGALEKLAWGYLHVGRYEDALAICQKNAGRRVGTGEREHAFAISCLETIADLKKQGKGQPTLEKIEALLTPTTRPATQPSPAPSSRPTSRPGAP